MTLNRLMILASVAAALTACPTPTPNKDAGTGGGTGNDGGTVGETVNVAADVTADTTWKAANTYVLKTVVHVDNATLTIEPGTKILGDNGSALVTTRNNGKLIAEGTATAPIVFTANAPVGMRGIGSNNWGGVLLNGKAPINIPGNDNLDEGLLDDPKHRYGGTDAAWNCGSLKYVRIEFAGQPLTANNELNGLTLCGCGSATSIDYVQVHRGIDDGIEVFGGTVNIKHAVITGSDDDGLDWDQGWTGKAQFVVIQQLVDHGNHGFEADNNRNDNEAMPRSAPTIWNATLIGRYPNNTNGGEGTSRGMVLRVGTAGHLNNLIVTNFVDWAINVNGNSSKTQWASGALSIKNSIFFANPPNLADGGAGRAWSNVVDAPLADGGIVDNGFDEAAELQVAALANRDIDPQVTDIASQTMPNYKPKAGSPAFSMAGTPPNDGFFDTTATFVGGVGSTDWTTGWTSYPEN